MEELDPSKITRKMVEEKNEDGCVTIELTFVKIIRLSAI